MSRTFTLTGRASVRSANYYPPIELENDRECGLGLVGFFTYNSILNIDENNNLFIYKHRDTNKVKTIVFPPGVYEIDILAKYIQKQIITAGGGRARHAISGSNKQQNARSPARLLGFSPVLYKPDEMHESDLPVEIIKVRIVRIDCDITCGTYSKNQAVHSIYEFDIDIEPGYKLTKELSSIIHMPITSHRHVDNITASVKDQHGNLIDFRNEEITVRLELKRFN